MLRERLAKGHDECLWDLMDSYRRERGGAYSMEDLSDWILANRLLPPPRVNPRQILVRKLKQAARRRRFTDLQGRAVRTMVAAKYERLDENGNMILEVVWDYLHEMSVDHALVSFSQRDENICKQRRSATRDVQSFIDNNPNAKGHEAQFQFGFMLEEPRKVVVETVTQTDIAPAQSLGKKKPR
jgi:hypothetical protein